ncbi:hypothetical protein AB0G49_13735 [Streptomyces longwoodensis]|uniref:hypothetical protein n=1 Tax=Streptomyces longwoodensis TaxID=68231 RepID=UPI0033E12AB7
MTDYTALTAAAAHAVGPLNSTSEAVWLDRVRRLAVELAFTARQVQQDVEQLDATRPFAAYLEKVEIEESSHRGLLTLLPSSGVRETIRTEQETTLRGRDMIARARELEGRWVLVYRYNEPMAGSKTHNVRMVARLMDLGEGTLPQEVARQVLIGDAGGNEQRARQAWEAAGLPLTGPVPAPDFDRARRKLRGEDL